MLAAGAAVNSLPETDGVLPITPVAGHVVELEPEDGGTGGAYPEGAPSLLGPTYLAWAGERLCVGATKEYGEMGAAASAASGEARGAAADEAAAFLRAEAARVWPPSASWRTRRVLRGTRGTPPRTPAGAVPLTGCLNGMRGDEAVASGQDWWLLGGLGARGLVYHGLLGRSVADAVLGRDASRLYEETIAWQSSSSS